MSLDSRVSAPDLGALFTPRRSENRTNIKVLLSDRLADHMNVLLGLFRKAIVMSGSVTSPWSGAQHPGNSSRGIARSLGCLSATSTLILSCLRTKPTQEVLRAFETQYRVSTSYPGGKYCVHMLYIYSYPSDKVQRDNVFTFYSFAPSSPIIVTRLMSSGRVRSVEEDTESMMFLTVPSPSQSLSSIFVMYHQHMRCRISREESPR
jgi:Carboxylesterase.